MTLDWVWFLILELSPVGTSSCQGINKNVRVTEKDLQGGSVCLCAPAIQYVSSFEMRFALRSWFCDFPSWPCVNQTPGRPSYHQGTVILKFSIRLSHLSKCPSMTLHASTVCVSRCRGCCWEFQNHTKRVFLEGCVEILQWHMSSFKMPLFQFSNTHGLHETVLLHCKKKTNKNLHVNKPFSLISSGCK